MPSDLSRLTAVDRPTSPSAISGPGGVSPSRALTRVQPVAPEAPISAPVPGFGRSGLDLTELLTTTDLVATREATGSVAMEVGLEQARGALLRNLPGDSLAILDGVWHAARRTEEGWYLRSAALTVLGLPGESERVAEEGLTQRPTSLALRFVQSVARFALGDMAGARAVLQPAIADAPKEPVLLVQHALVLARQGDTRGANEVLSTLERFAPDHPALAWGRAALRSINADATRQRSRATPVDWPSAITPRSVTAVRATPPSGTEDFSSDVSSAALERFGARVTLRPSHEVAREARMLIRAFSAGGTLSAATTAEQAHAARVVLSTFVSVAARERTEAPAPVRSMVEQLLPLMQEGRVDEAERLIRKQSMLAREPIGRLLLAVTRGARIAVNRETAARELIDPVHVSSLAATTASSIAPEDGESVVVEQVVHEVVERGAVVPMRLGLALLEETPASRSNAPTPAVSAEVIALAVNAEHNARRAHSGWTATHSGDDGFERAEWSDGAGVRAVALVCVALAAAAVFTGHGVVAIALGMGAAWLGLRRSGRERRTPDTHDRVDSQ